VIFMKDVKNICESKNLQSLNKEKGARAMISFTTHRRPLLFPAAFALSSLLLLSSACGPTNSSVYKLAVKIDPSESERGAADLLLVDYKSGGNVPEAAVPSSDRPVSVDWVALEAAAHETTVAIIGKYMHKASSHGAD